MDLDKWLKRLPIDPMWDISIELDDSDYMENYGVLEYDAENWKAIIRISRDVPQAQIDNIIIHELLELMFVDITDVWDSVLHEDLRYRSALDNLMDIAKHKFINKLVPIIRGVTC